MDKHEEKFNVEMLLADEYLQTGLCPSCNCNDMKWVYSDTILDTGLLCPICGLSINIVAYVHVLHSVPQWEMIVPDVVEYFEITPDSWLF